MLKNGNNRSRPGLQQLERRFALATMIVLVLALAAPACGGGSGASKDSSAVESLLERQLALAKASDWQGLYDTYSPRYQSRCPYEAVLRRARGADPASLQSLSYDQLHVQIEGDMAYVTYVTKRDGQVVAAVTNASPDIYVKVDGVWYDEYDELAACSGGGVQPIPTQPHGPQT